MAAETQLIFNLTRGNTICVGELADRPLPRMRGLMGRSGLPAGEGMLLRPAPSIHTAFMRFPIDAVFLDRELVVLEVVERLRPWRMASKRRARAVLELPAGEAERRGVRAGDRLELRDLCEAGAAPGETQSVPAADVERAMSVPPSGDGGEVRAARLCPLSVVIISPDRRFATVMSLLLSRRNCSVATTPNAGRARELIAREKASAVIVDADAPRSAAAIAAVQACTPPVGLVLVAEDVGHEPAAERTFSKWGPFDDLVGAIERAEELSGARAVQS